jgi:zinc protease
MNPILETKRRKYSNGLKLITHLQPSSEVVALHFCVQAGYFLETDSEVGLAHLLEHMYFKGSAKFPVANTIGVRMKTLGGLINASTSYDQTNYYCAVPKENLVPAFEIMTDAFLEPLFPEDELRRECEVVIEEFNRKLDSPSAYSLEKLTQLAYTQHRMKRWRIGTPESLRSFTRDHLYDYFRKYYQPTNIVVTIAGNFDEQQMADRVEGSWGMLKGLELQKDFGPSEPEQISLRHSTVKGEATQSYLHWGFHVPGVLSKDGPALEFLSFLLSGGKSARLHRYLVEQKQSASSISCGYSAYEDVGMVVFSAVTEASNIRKAGEDMWASLTDLREHGISSQEIEKVKNKLRLYRATQTEEVLGLAQLLGYHEAYGGFEKIEENQQAMEALTEKELLDVASKYFRPENLSVLEFVNQEILSATPDEYLSSMITGHSVPEVTLPPPVLIERRSLAGRIRSRRPLIHQGKITYILHEDPHYAQISAGLFFQGGRNQESDANAGITHFLLRLLLKGTDRWNSEQIAFRFDGLGNSPRMNCSRDYGGYTFETLPEYFHEAWNLLLHCLKHARFPEQEIKTEKRKILAAIQKTQDDNVLRPMQLFHRAFFGGHPYGLTEMGSEESISQIGQDDLKRWAGQLMTANRAVAVIVGNFDSNELIPLLEKGLSSFPVSKSNWEAPSHLLTPVYPEQLETRPKKQTAFFLGFPAPLAINPEIHKYSVLQQVLSGMGGRLFQNLRSQKSLAYSVAAVVSSFLYGGTFMTYIAGNAAKEKEAMDGMWEELENLKKDGIRRDELEKAVNSLMGSYALSTQTASSRVQDYFNCHVLGRPIPFLPNYRELLQKIETEDIRQIARDTFVRDHSALGIVRGTTEQTLAEKLILV